MKAVLCTRYGSPEVLELRDVAKPAPKTDEVLIRLRAAAVTTGDCELRSFTFPPSFWLPLRLAFGLRKPRRGVLGMYFAGDVEAVGGNVTRFRSGDAVFGASGFRLGANAEYLCLPETACLGRKPVVMSYDEAATVPVGGLNALHFLRKGELGPGQRILINGAGGSIGTYAVQLARHSGAQVTAVDSADKLEFLRALGAEHVIDYQHEDFAEGGVTYDVIFDVVGSRSFDQCERVLASNGRFLLANPKGLGEIARALLWSRGNDKKVILEFADERAEDLAYLTTLIEDGHLRAVVDRRYPLDELSDAHRYLETGRQRGCVVLSIA